MAQQDPNIDNGKERPVAQADDPTASFRADRRQLLKRSVVVALPVVLASVRGRNAWAGHGGGGQPKTKAASINPSKK